MNEARAPDRSLTPAGLSSARALQRATAPDGAPRLAWLLGLLLATLALWNARGVLAFDFVARDDDINIIFNPHLGPPSAQSLGWMFTDVAYMRRYVPLGWLAFSGVYQYSGLSPAGYHAANLGLHVANTVLVYALLFALCRRFGPESEPDWQAAAAAVGAAFWSLHPMRAETIGWSSGLLYGAAGFWALLSALAYLRVHFTESAHPARKRWLVAAALCYTLSVLTYPVGIALALVFVLIDFAVPRDGHPAGRPTWRRLAIEKLAFLVPGAAIAAVTLFGRFEVSSFWPRAPSWEEFTLAQRIAQAFAVWAYYVGKTIWPMGLTSAPTWLFEVDVRGPIFLASAAFVIGLTVLLASRSRWRNGLRLWLAYLVILSPLVGFADHPHFTSDRYSYLAGIAISAAVAFGILRRQPEPARLGVLMVAGLFLLIFGMRQHAQLKIWENTDALLARIIARSGDINFSVEHHRIWAMFHAQRGRTAPAREILLLAERAAPNHPNVNRLRSDLAAYEASGARIAGAPPPAYAWQLHEKLALDFARAGRTVEAHEHFRAAWQLAPESGTLAFNWGVLCAVTSEPRRSLHLYLCASSAAGDDRPALADRLRLLGLIAESSFATGQTTLAIRTAEAAVRLAQSSPDSGLAAGPQAQLERFRPTGER